VNNTHYVVNSVDKENEGN